MLLLGKITHYVLVLQAGWEFDFDTDGYIFISFYILLNKHFGSIITRIRFDFHRKNQPARFFYNSIDEMKS